MHAVRTHGQTQQSNSRALALFLGIMVVGLSMAQAARADERAAGVIIKQLPVDAEFNLLRIHTVAFDASAARIFSVGESSWVLWDSQRGRILKQAAFPDGAFGSVVLSATGRRALLADSGTEVKLIDTDNWDVVQSLGGNKSKIRALALSTDGKKVLAGSDDKMVSYWDLGRRSSGMTPFAGHTDWVRAVAFSPDGNLALSGGDDRTLRLWDLKSGRAALPAPMTGHTGGVSSVAFSPDGKQALSGSDDTTLRLWDLESGQEVRRFLGHEDWVRCVAFSPDGKWALSGSADATVRLWDVATGSTAHIFVGHKDQVISVGFSLDGRKIISGSRDKTVRIWNIPGFPAAR